MGDSIRAILGASSLARVSLFTLVLSLTALAACGDNAPKPGDGPFGTGCDEDKDCESLICAAMEGDPRICTESCTDPLGDECAAGFKCRRPDREEGMVCVCTDPSGCEVDDPPAEECTADFECDDDIECTVDSCLGEECTFAVRPELCEVGSSCDPDVGCVENPECVGNDECTISSDSCRQGGFCDPVSGRCQFALTDNDADGAFPEECGGNDCDDFDSNVAGGRADVCDQIDNDCDRFVDEDAERMCGGMSCSFGDCFCEGGLTDCSGTGQGCVDTFSDRNNCGGCGFACEGGFFCNGGVCTDVDECFEGRECPPHSSCANTFGTFECRCDFGFEPNASRSECVDVNECARGFHNCGSAANCVNLFGGFECDCAPGFQDLGMGCQDINECQGFSCGHGVCRNTQGGFHCECNFGYAPHPTTGVCRVVDECQAGVLNDFRWCDGACRDLRNDSSYCGSCFNECVGPSFCSGRECVCDNSALTYCNNGDTCVNLRNDEQNCGFCGNVCPGNATCTNGECQCPMGQVPCNDQCVAIGTAQNCLGCFDSCAIGSTCTEDGCQCPTSAPTQCDGACVNTRTHEQHCGGCYFWCPEDATCTSGQCRCPANAPNLCQDSNTCNDFDTSENACGACGSYCSGICNEGECAQAELIALGGEMGCVLFSDGRVGCFGNNGSGRLGRGLSASLTAQELGLLSLSNVVAIAARDAHACAVQTGGAVQCWGENSSQQLGNGNTTDQNAPVATRAGAAQVAVGLAHTCVVLTGTGKVECTGSDASGQRGDGEDEPAIGTWTGPAALEDVDELVSGQNHLCALVDGEVFCWGDNSSGQLGNGTSGASVDAPVKVTGLSGVTDIAAGRNHTCAVADGDVYCWGESSSYQTGSPETTDLVLATSLGFSNAIQVAAGDAHTCAVVEHGNVWCWGSGSDRQNGATMTGPELHGLGGPWAQLAAGSAHTCGILTEGGDFYCWGDGPSIAFFVDTAGPIRIAR
jgi:alpha-tubulin suppressor-like RCC1 family protein